MQENNAQNNADNPRESYPEFYENQQKLDEKNLENIESDFSDVNNITKSEQNNFENFFPKSKLSKNFLPNICSIAKREEEIFLPNEKKPVIFEKGSPELMVLQKARDESHRFSITANRTARMKAMKKNILEELP